MRYRIWAIVLVIGLCGCGQKKATTTDSELPRPDPPAVVNKPKGDTEPAVVNKPKGDTEPVEMAKIEPEKESAAAQYFTKLGGTIERDESKPGKPVVFLGLSYKYDKVTDDVFKQLAPLKGLATLVLYSTNVSNEGLKEIAQLKGLISLDLSNTKMTDAGLKEIVRLKNLTALSLSYNEDLTDMGIKELTQLKELTSLTPVLCTSNVCVTLWIF